MRYAAATALAFLCSSFFTSSFAGEEKKAPADSIKEHSRFELSFGQSLIFVSYDKTVKIRDSANVVIPTSSMLFFAEARPFKRLRIPFFFNLPTESKQYLVNGQLVYVKASPTFGTGIQYSFLRFSIDSRSKFDFAAGPLASFLLSQNDRLRFAPVLAGRLRVVRDTDFVMYLGTSYSLGINAWGILYGTGFFF